MIQMPDNTAVSVLKKKYKCQIILIMPRMYMYMLPRYHIQYLLHPPLSTVHNHCLKGQ